MCAAANSSTQDVSDQALGLARMLDRACTRPGRYIVIVDIPDPKQHAWEVEIHEAGVLRRQRLRRR